MRDNASVSSIIALNHAFAYRLTHTSCERPLRGGSRPSIAAKPRTRRNFGIKIPSGEGGTFLNANFEILDFTPEGKTINQLIAENNLKPGDLIFFKDHNQIIIDEKRAFDGGRGNTEKVARGSTFNLWLGPNKYLNTKVGYILRSLDAE